MSTPHQQVIDVNQVDDVSESTEWNEYLTWQESINGSSVAMDTGKDDPTDDDGPGETMQRAIRDADERIHLRHFSFVQVRN
jgi:hypothetical protein